MSKWTTVTLPNDGSPVPYLDAITLASLARNPDVVLDSCSYPFDYQITESIFQ